MRADALAVRVEGLVKRYGDLVAVGGIDLAVRRGSSVALLGPNGAGKTTTIEILEGLSRPDEGVVEVLGRTFGAAATAIRERIGVQLQETRFEDKLTCRELLRMFACFYERGEDVERVLALVDLAEKRDAWVSRLSGGQRQRLALGTALLGAPELLFLDEPTTGLDPAARRRLWEIVERFKADGGTVLFTTHYMEEAERLADEVVIMDRGRVIARGLPGAIIESLGAESVVEFVATRDGVPVELPEDALRALPGVRSVRREGAATILTVGDTRAAVSALFAASDRGAFALEDLRTHRATLEDVFVALTGKHLSS